MITHNQAVKLIGQHGFTPTQNTGWFPDTGLEAENSSFYSEFGIKDTYNGAEVMAWLGY